MAKSLKIVAKRAAVASRSTYPAVLTFATIVAKRAAVASRSLDHDHSKN